MKLRAFAPTVLINGVAPEAADWVPLIELAVRDRAVVAVLAFLGLPTTFRTLYAALETVRHDWRTGEESDLLAWAGVSKTQLDLFEHTANSYDAIGTEARHGITAKAGPRKPMGLDQATELVYRAVEGWMQRLLWLAA
jgi:hypothetical protein